MTSLLNTSYSTHFWLPQKSEQISDWLWGVDFTLMNTLWTFLWLSPGVWLCGYGSVALALSLALWFCGSDLITGPLVLWLCGSGLITGSVDLALSLAMWL